MTREIDNALLIHGGEPEMPPTIDSDFAAGHSGAVRFVRGTGRAQRQPSAEIDSLKLKFASCATVCRGGFTKMNAEQKQQAIALGKAWGKTAYGMHADAMAALLQEMVEAQAKTEADDSWSNTATNVGR